MANPAGWQGTRSRMEPLRELDSAIATIQPQNQGEAVIEAELLKSWNELYQARSSRLSAVEGHIPGVIWWIVFFGAAITTGYTYLFGFENFGMHIVMTATMAATLRSADHCSRLPLSWRNQYHPGPVHHDSTIMD